MPSQFSISNRTAKRIISVLHDEGAMTTIELSRSAHLSQSSAKQYLRLLHASSLIHIAAYTFNNNGQPVRRYGAGEADDAALPTSLTLRSTVSMSESLSLRQQVRRANALLDPLTSRFLGVSCHV